jgi:hypothetical protein
MAIPEHKLTVPVIALLEAGQLEVAGIGAAGH